ncbi:DNA adenine methylase [Streptococcus suis]|uniref:DNA adenine methylase n=1 Tax=Streptococcus suis TaxID=1307 RepID=UPI00209AD0BF|nr:DNA adenine methylase [Streptococcus suis]MCO8188331.1 DNA adenine methylase [Streptococcus suis]MCO8204209.1 DNA adenine methylase [Streptococcus suis]MCO8204943.1 DNA adenine methylase [Streptococcus suis]MCO8212596.1 DNA adenine methylase [Streptococcus suis]MCO8229771.1 DNA adenine methylase [Streptococcus suis]
MYKYIGNKTKILDEVLKEISHYAHAGDTVVDLMSGTGTVAEGMRREGYKVIASDMMTYSYFHNLVRLNLTSYPEFENLKISTSEKPYQRYMDILSYLNNLPPCEGYYFNEFSPGGTPQNSDKPRFYFTSENASKIDSIVNVLNTWRDSGEISAIENAVLRHTLILAVNDIANVSGTYGHYHAKQINKSKDKLFLKDILEIDLFSDSIKKHVVLQGYAEDLASKISAKVCYIDPPYTKRQYAANYHVLETIARGDFPPAIGASGLRPWRDQYSNFNSKLKIRESFRKIILSMNCSIFIISYSEDGLLTKDEMIALLSEFGHVDFRAFSHKRFKSNDSKLPQKLDEFLFTLIRK